jgi:hypothetical protein
MAKIKSETSNIAPDRSETIEPDRPSNRMVRNWAKNISKGRANVIPVFVDGAWTLHVLRGHKRVLQFSLGKDKKSLSN